MLVGVQGEVRSRAESALTLWELVFVGLELLLEFTHVGGVFIEEYLEQIAVSHNLSGNINRSETHGTISSLKHIEPLLRTIVFILG